jgi:hypothetical protein
MDHGQSLEYRFVLAPADLSGVYIRARNEDRFRALRRLTYCLLIGVLLMFSTNFLDGFGALGGVLGVVGMMTIVTGVMTNFGSILARQGAVAHFEPEPTLIRVDGTGISRFIADREIHVGWRLVDKITLTDFGVGLVMPEDSWFIPASAFGSEPSMKAGYDDIVSVMASAQLGQVSSDLPTLH